jgi:hypothetical protein
MSAEEFRRNPRTRDGLSSWCAACHNERNRRWREENPEPVEAYNEARRLAYPAKRRRRIRRLELQRGRSPDGETSRVSPRTRSLISAFRCGERRRQYL